MRYEMTEEKWANAMRDYLERRNPDATPEEIAVLLAQLLGEN
jgi:hypothetical protein